MTVWDAFMFNGEFEALHARLAVPGIDKRILVEALMTHSGKPKKELFYNWSLPGVRLVVPDLRHFTDPWERENAQRNAIMDGLDDAAPTDMVLVSDIDEVPTPDAIERGSKALQHHAAVVFCQTSYNFDRRWHDPRGWRGTIMTTVENLREHPPQELRDARESLHRIDDAGEHLSWWGGPAEVSRKLESFAHSEYSHMAGDSKTIRERMAAGEDLFGRWKLTATPTEGPKP